MDVRHSLLNDYLKVLRIIQWINNNNWLKFGTRIIYCHKIGFIIENEKQGYDSDNILIKKKFDVLIGKHNVPKIEEQQQIIHVSEEAIKYSIQLLDFQIQNNFMIRVNQQIKFQQHSFQKVIFNSVNMIPLNPNAVDESIELMFMLPKKQIVLLNDTVQRTIKTISLPQMLLIRYLLEMQILFQEQVNLAISISWLVFRSQNFPRFWQRHQRFSISC
ncbi:unnamed protein product [Paramecium sonneborni]|uniref:Uncharacterized protein n=1 Tax=Paramecium sonneborni TaxID=65129 RepID=A0A8S1KPM7_9CILI|nr:unnamed protein product [Paramecium sonneborni]